jgi:hypothetical protein
VIESWQAFEGGVTPIMVETADFISIPYTPDLSQAGIRRACQRLALERLASDEDSLAALFQCQYQTALELAFLRHLQENEIPFEQRAAAPLTDPEKMDLMLGGRRLVLRNFPITGKNQIRRLLGEPEFILNGWARLPQEHGEIDARRADDVYVFAFIAAPVAQQGHEFQRALRAQQPVFLLHLLPDSWARRGYLPSLGHLALKADSDQDMRLELGGQDAGQQFHGEWIFLPPRQRVQTQAEFLSLAYLHAVQLPEGRTGVYSPALDQLHIVGPDNWFNVWVYGMRIVLTGFIPRHEFQRKAYLVTQAEASLEMEAAPYLKLPIAQLYPMQALFEQARLWKSPGGMGTEN